MEELETLIDTAGERASMPPIPPLLGELADDAAPRPSSGEGLK